MTVAGTVGVEFACFPKRPIEIVRGSGATLWDSKGQAYIDCGASYGVANLGYSNPAVVAAIEAQARELIHVGPAFPTAARHAFLDRLVAIAPPNLSRVFLSNSGTEAVEAALKFARSATKRTKIVAAMRGFHGRTMGALSATWRRDFREPFEPLVPGFTHVPYNDVGALRQAADRDTAAVILEAVQGEGGVHVASAEYLPAAREICDRTGALLIVDEVQTGMGRTGRIFAIERWNVLPDIVTLAKSLAGGVPIGATLCTSSVEDQFVGSHNSTFGGSPLACAAGSAAIEYLLKERLWERADRLGSLGIQRLAQSGLPIIREVRGVGLMIGIELKERASPYLEALAQRGVLVIGGGSNVIRLLPPLVITESDWTHALDSIEAVLGRG
jgi:LysW-gamma-L-lysine/LysW-L-ornithine aminotransferase